MGEWFGVVGMIVGVPIFAVILTLINEISENNLRKKNLPVNSAEYYADGSETNHYDENKNFSQKVFSSAGTLFGKIMKLVFRKDKDTNIKKEEKEKEKEEDNNE